MKAVVLNKVNTPLEVQPDHAEPVAQNNADPSTGVIIDVTACGVCHSDLHVVDGDFGSNLPIILGHEVTGVHPTMGPVIMYAPWGCLRCDQCTDGLENMCPEATEAGLFVDGGYAERMWVRDESYLAPLDGLDPIAAAPLACGGLTAYRAVKHTLETLRGRGGNGRALIVGAGGLGQYAIRYLQALTDTTLVVMDAAADKRANALDMGVAEAVAPDEAIDACDAVIDFIGVDATLAYSVAATRRRGIMVAVGLGGGTVPFGFGNVPHEARLMTSVWGSRSELDELLDLVCREPSVLQPVETMPLDDAQAAHDRLRAGEVKGRVVLLPHGST